MATVLLLHSHGMSARQWRRLERALVERGDRAVVPDLLGHGSAPPWPDGVPVHFHHEVAALAPHLTEAGERVHLIGHSYGGLLALQLAAAHPGAVASLAVYDPVAWGVIAGDDDPAVRADAARVHFGWSDDPDRQRAWFRGFVDYWQGVGAWDQLRPENRAEFERVGRVIHDGARALVADRTPASAYAGIAAPALLMTGTETPVTERRVVDVLAATLPRARLEVIEGAGHMGPLTHPEPIWRSILALLASTRA